MGFEDRELRCVTCGQTFVWSAGEQAYFVDKRLPHEPKHCRSCKPTRRPSQADGPAPPRRAPRLASEATCSQCGRSTTVPFRPAVGRPVFCKTCYQSRRSLAGR